MLDSSCANACALNGLPGPVRHCFTGFTHSLTHSLSSMPLLPSLKADELKCTRHCAEYRSLVPPDAKVHSTLQTFRKNVLYSMLVNSCAYEIPYRLPPITCTQMACPQAYSFDLMPDLFG